MDENATLHPLPLLRFEDRRLYWKGQMPELSARTEKRVFKVYGVILILAGLSLVGISCWLAWNGWVRISRWPQTNALLVSKDLSKVGARLVFRYQVYGRALTGVGFRWGSETSVRSAMQSYTPGTIHRIAYNPEDPFEIEPTLQYNWSPIEFGVLMACLFVGGGAVFYRSRWV